jgi:integrative and conjugative element protein (TIGR02256 family)
MDPVRSAARLSRVRNHAVIRLHVPGLVLDRILSLVADHDDPTTETGGIILGHDDGRIIEVTGVGGPGPRAVHEPTRFTRDLQYAGKVAADAWRRDRSQWIGEWHTHPRGHPAPSDLDLRTYVSLLRNPSLRLDRFITVIVATGPNTAIAAWLVTSTTLGRLPIRVLSSNA